MRDWYRLSWQDARHPFSDGTGWEAARVSGDLVLRSPGAQDGVLLRDDGLVETRPLSAEEAPMPPSGGDLGRCAWIAAILAMRRADPPLLPASIEVEATASGGFSLRWETAKDRGRFLGFTQGGTVPSYGAWGRGTRRCASVCGCGGAFSPTGSG